MPLLQLPAFLQAAASRRHQAAPLPRAQHRMTSCAGATVGAVASRSIECISLVAHCSSWLWAAAPWVLQHRATKAGQMPSCQSLCHRVSAC